MIKIVAIGLWVCLVALGSLFFGFKISSTTEVVVEPTVVVNKTQYDRTDLISVPIMMDETVQGYIISQLVFTYDTAAKDKIDVPIKIYINDAIFNVFFRSYTDRREFERVNFSNIKQDIIADVNAHYPEPVLKDLMVEQFNFITSQDVRDLNSQT